METFKLNTTQNVTLDQRLASIGDRMLAYLLDTLFTGLYLITLLIIFSTQIKGLEAVILILLIPVLFYHFLFEVLFNGQSPGKMIMKIRVVKADGSHLSIGACFIRWIFRIIDVTLFMGAIAVLTLIINGKGQRLGDIAASTTVLKTPKKNKLERSSWIEIEDQYKPTFNQVDLLTDRDVQIIKEVIEATQKNPQSATSIKLLKQTRAAIVKKTSIDSKMADQPFLLTIIKDFNAFHKNAIQETNY